MITPFTIVIDSREQAPYSFLGLISDARDGRQPLIVPTTISGLPSGDYSILGHENEVAAERKSKEDLFNSIGGERARFQRELARLAVFPSATLVVVESSWEEIITAPPPFSQLAPKIIHRSVLAWMLRFPTVHWVMCPDRRFAEVTAFRFLERWWKNWAAKNGVNAANTANLENNPSQAKEAGATA